jgi:hypothetical protein
MAEVSAAEGEDTSMPGIVTGLERSRISATTTSATASSGDDQGDRDSSEWGGLQIGDMVRVTNAGKCYSILPDMFRSLGFANTARNESFLGVAVVFGRAMHPRMDGKRLLAIRNAEGREMLIGIDGIVAASAGQQESDGDSQSGTVADMASDATTGEAATSPASDPAREVYGFSVGETVRVVNTGKCYDTFSAMFRQLGFANTSVNNSFEGTGVVFAMALHPTMPDQKLIAIRNAAGQEMLIGSEGIAAIVVNPC